MMVLILWAVSAHASIRFDHTINSITFVDEKGITKNIAIILDSKLGYRLKDEDLSKDINKLIVTGEFERVIPKTVTTENGLKLFFECVSYPQIKNIKLNGNTVFSDRELMRQMKNKKRRKLNTKYLKEDIQKITDYYHTKGYDLFRVISAEMNGDVLVIKMSEGKIEDIRWEGLDIINPKLINRKMSCKPKSVFNSYQLRNDRDTIIQTGYFRDVSAPLLQENGSRTSVIVTFQVTEKKANRFDTGIELDIRDDTLVSFFRGNMNHLIMHGDGLSGTVQLNLERGEISVKNHAVRYTQPWKIFKKPVDFSVEGWLREERERVSNSEDDNLYDLKRYGGSLAFTLPLIQNQCYTTSTFKLEKVENKDVDLIDLSPYSVQSLGQAVNYYKLDSQFNPRKGVYWSLSLEKGMDMGLIKTGALAFTRGQASIAGFTPLSDKLVAAARMYTGVFRPDNDDIEKTFEQEVYEIGGPNTLRGYRTNRAFIGFREILWNFELRRDISEKKQLVFFLDAGKIFETGYDLSLNDLHTGYGVGIRFFTPIGPLRFDLARGETDTILHFSLGQLF